MTHLKLTIHCALAAVLLACTGCGGLSKPYPEKSLHALSLGDPPAPSGDAMKVVLRIDRVHIAQPFDGQAFVYKVGDSRFITDYYSGFVADPPALVTGALAGWMSKAGLFKSVISGDSSADYQIVLESDITSMYGSFEPNKDPAAVLEARFFVINEAGGRFDVIFDKSYREAEPIDRKSPKPDGLVQAWNSAWQRMLSNLATDLRAAPAVSSASAN